MTTFETRPLIGTGSGTFKAAVDYKDKSAHNTYLAILIESGAIGLGLFILVALTSALHLKELPRTERMFYLTLLIVLGVGITTMSWEIKKPTWFILTMVMVHAAVFIKPVSVPSIVPPRRKPVTTLVTE